MTNGDKYDNAGNADGSAERPLLRVVNSDATPEEIAAIVAVLASLGGGAPAAKARRPEWNAPHRLHRRPVHAGPGGWRGSSLPADRI